ncbi:WD40 repeat-like protein [Obba rivulosa]|uniref:WD40 repeat-like protein n=1 Tax=Obba rivulosa TaxID=1052685 RepID=A0A8E2J7C3_9APHY|nr:WD40 repeat-like protein [Obba rivulosa]
MTAPLLITSDEINCLIHAYFEDSGFQHSAFVLRAEARLEQSPNFGKFIPRGELVELLSKALLYVETETHWKGTGLIKNCTRSFSLLERHVCELEQPVPAIATLSGTPAASSAELSPRMNGTGRAEPPASKRKASTPASDLLPKEKRARTSPIEDNPVETQVKVADSDIPVINLSSPEHAPPPRPPPRRVNEVSISDPVTLLRAHKAEVFVCAWNPTKPNLLASGSKDTVVHLWNVPEPKLGIRERIEIDPPLALAMTPKATQADMTSLDWTPDGTLLAIGSYDAMLRVCNASGELYFTHAQHQKGPIFAARFSKSGRWLLTASLDGTACVWDMTTKGLRGQYRCHQECCLDVDWLTEEYFASCGADGRIQIMNLDMPSPVKTLLGHGTEVNQVKCNESRTRLASCSDDCTARVWNIEDVIFARPVHDEPLVLKGHTQIVSTIAWCPVTSQGEQEILASSAFDGTLRLWNSVTGDCLQMFHDHTRHVFALAFSPDARLLATGAGDGLLHIYDVKTREKRWTWDAGYTKPAIFEIDWQQTGSLNRLAVALESQEVAVVDINRIPSLQ